MAKKKSIHPLHKPVHPVFPALVAVISIVALGILIASLWQNNRTLQQTTLQNKPTPTPTIISVAPVQVDMSDWKTYTDWKYGFSIKLPQQFCIVVSASCKDTSDSDLNGSGEMSFADVNAGEPNNIYGFGVRIHKGNHRDIPCTTDEECFNRMYGLEKNFPDTNTFPVETKILNRTVEGFAEEAGQAYISAGSINDVYFEFAVNGTPYELVIDGGIDSHDQLKAKLPYIGAIASTISFNN